VRSVESESIDYNYVRDHKTISRRVLTPLHYLCCTLNLSLVNYDGVRVAIYAMVRGGLFITALLLTLNLRGVTRSQLL